MAGSIAIDSSKPTSQAACLQRLRTARVAIGINDQPVAVSQPAVLKQEKSLMIYHTAFTKKVEIIDLSTFDASF